MHLESNDCSFGCMNFSQGRGNVPREDFVKVWDSIQGR